MKKLLILEKVSTSISVRHFLLSQIQIFAFFWVGSFGRVSKIRRVSDGRILVWKELDYGKMSDKEKQ